MEYEIEDVQMQSIETLNKQLEEKEQQLDEYVSDLKNDIFSDEAEKLRKEIYELQDKIDILKRKKMDEADGIFKKLGISVDLEILENLISDFRYNQITLDCVFKELDAEDIQAIENLVQAYKQQAVIIKNSVSKDKVIEIIKQIKQCEQTAAELIEERVVIADSDSLNFGRRQAHNYDAELIKHLLLEGDE